MARWAVLTLPVVCLALLLLLSGCAAGPLGGPYNQERPVHLVLNNSANSTQIFEVSVVEAGTNGTVRLNDGRTGNYTIGQGLVISSSGEYYYTAVELADSARVHGRYTLEPGEVKRLSIEEFHLNSAVVVVLSKGEKIGWWASAYCSDGALVTLGVTSRPGQAGGDAWAGYRCR